MWTADADLLGEMTGSGGAVTCLAHEGFFLFSGCEGGAISAWDLHQVLTGARQSTGGAYFCVQVSAGGLLRETLCYGGLGPQLLQLSSRFAGLTAPEQHRGQ